jgi:acyl-CoA synthetase (NDP forming)
MNPKLLFKKVITSKRNSLTILESRELLDFYRIPLVRATFVKTVEEAVTAGRKIGYPVVMKIVSPQIIHKTDVGGIAINVNSDGEVRKTFDNLMKNVKKKIPRAKIDGILVERMIKDGQEVIIGGKEDPTFGKIVMFGLGGIFTELLNDLSIRMVPVSRNDCLEMMMETKGYKVLSGYRGKKYDLDSIVNVLLKVSRILEENKEIKEMDINPLIVSEAGAVAVDARIIV